MTEQHFGDYTILNELATSRMGTLYAAEHRFLKKPFTIKVLPQQIVSHSSFIQRIDTELSALSSLEHPHILRVHNISCHEGRYYLVGDYKEPLSNEGMSLSKYLQKHPSPLPEKTIYAIALQLADALDFAHQMGPGTRPLSHRSLMMSNIFIENKNEGPFVYLSDFGLWRLTDDEYNFASLCADLDKGLAEDEAHRRSAMEHFLESYNFLAPELRCSHLEKPLDEVKVDVYAFGVAIYYLFMRTYPEGVFEMPCELHSGLQYDWSRLLHECLQLHPLKRASKLLPLVESIACNQKTDASSRDGSYAFMPDIKPTEIIRPQFEPDPGAVFKTETCISRYQPQNTDTKNIDPLMSDMVIISGGTFFRGSNSGSRDESPRHQIVLRPFAIDICPVTNEQFVRFLEVMGGEKDGNNNDMIRLRESRIKRSGGKISIESGYARHPVVGVTWYGACAYAKWVGKRLPTEAEWEVAACGGLGDAIYPTGATIERSQANFFSSDTTAVMSYPSNDYGLFDMAGNVYEWCNDWYDYHYYNVSIQEPDNPKGPLQGVYRVLRGGCWKSLKDDMRSSHRHRNNPGALNGTYGFRCVADVVER